MRPTIAVVVPMLNAAQDLEVLFSSLSNQKFDEPWEIVAVDNNSDDGTADIARAFLQSPLHVNLVRSEVVTVKSPQGYATPRNAGVRATTAPLIAFCDADGAVDEHWLDAITGSLQEHYLVASRKFRSNDVSRRDEKTAWSEQRKLFTILGATFAATAGLGCTRELFDALGGFDTCFNSGGEDADFSFRARFQLGVEPHMELSAVYWSKVPSRYTKAISIGFRDVRTEFLLYQRHLGRNLQSPLGFSAIRRSLKLITYRLLRLHRWNTERRVEFARETGCLIGRMVWSVKFSAWYFRTRSSRKAAVGDEGASNAS